MGGELRDERRCLRLRGLSSESDTNEHITEGKDVVSVSEMVPVFSSTQLRGYTDNSQRLLLILHP